MMAPHCRDGGLLAMFKGRIRTSCPLSPSNCRLADWFPDICPICGSLQVALRTCYGTSLVLILTILGGFLLFSVSVYLLCHLTSLIFDIYVLRYLRHQCRRRPIPVLVWPSREDTLVWYTDMGLGY
jgi:hypothetical protein